MKCRKLATEMPIERELHLSFVHFFHFFPVFSRCQKMSINDTSEQKIR